MVSDSFKVRLFREGISMEMTFESAPDDGETAMWKTGEVIATGKALRWVWTGVIQGGRGVRMKGRPDHRGLALGQVLVGVRVGVWKVFSEAF